eukprot:6475174-Amphidinium_carterae.1
MVEEYLDGYSPSAIAKNPLERAYSSLVAKTKMEGVRSWKRRLLEAPQMRPLLVPCVSSFHEHPLGGVPGRQISRGWLSLSCAVVADNALARRWLDTLTKAALSTTVQLDREHGWELQACKSEWCHIGAHVEDELATIVLDGQPLPCTSWWTWLGMQVSAGLGDVTAKRLQRFIDGLP